MVDKENQDRINKDLSNRYKHFKPARIDNLFKIVHSGKDCAEMCEHYYDSDREGDKESLDFNNWEEPIFCGNWGLTQKDVNESCAKTLDKALSSEKFRLEMQERIFYERRRGYISYWMYTRDLFGVEYTFCYKDIFLIWLFWRVVWYIKMLYWKIKNYNDRYVE